MNPRALRTYCSLLVHLNTFCRLHCTHLIIVKIFRPFIILWPCHFFLCIFPFNALYSNFVSVATIFFVFLSTSTSVDRFLVFPYYPCRITKTGPCTQCNEILDIDWLRVCPTFVCVSFSLHYSCLFAWNCICYDVFTRKNQTSDFEKAVYIFPLFHISIECIHSVAIADNGLCILAVLHLCVFERARF